MTLMTLIKTDNTWFDYLILVICLVGIAWILWPAAKKDGGDAP